ncbi:MAG: LPS assembly lipoprotein LptE [Salinivirgaceae bacterium]|nr:LPS assembly lipoprotein LptE [Salinivirgaceae bacterium]
MKVKQLIMCLALALVSVSCTIKYSFTGASIPVDAKTFAVEDFKNMAPLINPDLANELSEALREKLLKQTSLKQARDYNSGDLRFSGTITNYMTAPTAIKSDDVASLNRLTIVITVTFENDKDPKSNYKSGFSRYADYNSENSLSDVESTLTAEIVEQLVDDIFSKAVVNW